MSKKHHKIPPEVKADIIRRIKEEGVPVAQAAKEHGVSEAAIYGWMGAGAQGGPSFSEFARLQKQNKELLELVGELRYGNDSPENGPLVVGPSSIGRRRSTQQNGSSQPPAILSVTRCTSSNKADVSPTKGNHSKGGFYPPVICKQRDLICTHPKRTEHTGEMAFLCRRSHLAG